MNFLFLRTTTVSMFLDPRGDVIHNILRNVARPSIVRVPRRTFPFEKQMIEFWVALKSVGDYVIPASFGRLASNLIGGRTYSLHRDWIINRLTRQKRDETLRGTFRLIILIKQKNELMPKQILQDHCGFGLKITIRLTPPYTRSHSSLELGGKQYLVAH
jgi:hypothetical protein